MSEDFSSYIVKKTLYASTASIPVRDGTKIFFHFQTRLCDEKNTLLDDSRKMGIGEPLHMVLGKKFKLEVWEAFLQTMALNEVAQFTVDKTLVMQYPLFSKTLRDMHKPKDERKPTHTCAMTIQTEGVGYDDLNDYLKTPQDLEFTMEIVQVQQPDEYEKETWQLDEVERIEIVAKLKIKGNEEYNKKDYKKASESYAKAIGILEQLMLKEKPHDVEWNQLLNEQKLPFLLNFSQCKLQEEDYYPVITHCTEVLRYDKDNVKAYFRRAKAHIAAWNPKEAKEDLERVMELDKSLIPLAKKELIRLEELQKLKDSEDKEKLKNMFV